LKCKLEYSRLLWNLMLLQQWMPHSLLEFPFSFIINFGKKRPILDKCSKKPLSQFGQVVLNLSIMIRPCTFLPSLSWHFWLIISTGTFD
jgi:hypothetical protein